MHCLAHPFLVFLTLLCYSQLRSSFSWCLYPCVSCLAQDPRLCPSFTLKEQKIPDLHRKKQPFSHLTPLPAGLPCSVTHGLLLLPETSPPASLPALRILMETTPDRRLLEQNCHDPHSFTAGRWEKYPLPALGSSRNQLYWAVATLKYQPPSLNCPLGVPTKRASVHKRMPTKDLEDGGVCSRTPSVFKPPFIKRMHRQTCCKGKADRKEKLLCNNSNCCACSNSSWRMEARGYSSVWEQTLGSGLIWEGSRGKFSKKKEKILWQQKWW